MANPLDVNRPTFGATTDLYAWCEEQNKRPLTARMGRWYHVTEVENVKRVDTLEGADGDAVWMLIDGVLPDYVGWKEERVTGYRKWITKVALNGMGEAMRAEYRAKLKGGF